MKLHEVGQFYGERNGWRMFDERFLTDDVRSYLDDEEEFLDHVMKAGYDRLIEVGCGYGRFMNWSLSRKYHYFGIDIVPWMVEAARLRAERARSEFNNENCSVVLHSAEEIHRVLERLKKEDSKSRSLVFFPFNSIGNLANFKSAMESLEIAGCDLVVSSFKSDDTASGIRLEYYKKCGYENLNSRILRQGLLIVSDEGFHAMAYNKDWLLDSFKEHGFSLVTEYEKPVACNIFYLRHGIDMDEETGESKIDKKTESTINKVDATVHVIERLSAVKAEEPYSARLLPLEEFQCELTAIGKNVLSGLLPEYLDKETILHLILKLPGQKGEEHCIDLTGRVTQAIAYKNQFETKIKLTREGELDRLGIAVVNR